MGTPTTRNRRSSKAGSAECGRAKVGGKTTPGGAGREPYGEVAARLTEAANTVEIDFLRRSAPSVEAHLTALLTAATDARSAGIQPPARAH